MKKAATNPDRVESRVREAIATELGKISVLGYPNLYRRTRTKVGYLEVEGSIIRMMISTGLTPAGCIINLENEDSL